MFTWVPYGRNPSPAWFSPSLARTQNALARAGSDRFSKLDPIRGEPWPTLALSRRGHTSWLPREVVRAYALPGKALSHVPGLGRMVDLYVDTWLGRFDVRDSTM